MELILIVYVELKMDKSQNVLIGREERAKLIDNYLKDYKTVISIKPNIPGEDKNSNLSYLIINAFSFLIDYQNYIFCLADNNDDGPFIVLANNEMDEIQIKTIMTNIEEQHELGRFIDIDVYGKSGLLSRNLKRKCIICNDDVVVCRRNNNHSFQEIISLIRYQVKKFYTNILNQIIDESIMGELNLEPKFGLVTPTSAGSHQDMDYEIMLKAKKTIVPHLIDLFFLSSESNIDSTLVEELRKVGKSAETDMLGATDNINAYKGLVFNLGLIISAFGVKLSRNCNDNIFSIVKKLAALLLIDDNYDSDSFGDFAYRHYNITGVKGQALSGFKDVQKGFKLLVDYSKKAKLQLLIYYISTIDDTTFLKRARSFEFYQEVKQIFSMINPSNEEELIGLTNYCVKHNLSFGGSADLLVVTIFIKKMNGIFSDIYYDKMCKEIIAKF